MAANQVQGHQHQISLRETFREEVPEGLQPPYNPGVNSSQSNYYFDNKLLYELYLERSQRNGQQNY